MMWIFMCSGRFVDDVDILWLCGICVVNDVDV